MSPYIVKQWIVTFAAKMVASNVAVFIVLLLLVGVQFNEAQAQKVIEFEVPLIINKGLSGNVNAIIIDTVRAGETSTEVKVSSERLKTLFRKYANDEQLITWFGEETLPPSGGSSSQIITTALKLDDSVSSAKQAQVSKSDSISLLKLRNRGLEISFDSSLLSISTVIPRLGTQNISLQGNRAPVPEDGYAQAKFSSGLNFRVRSAYSHRETAAVQSGFDDTSIDIDGFTSIGGFGGWGLFYGVNYDEGDEKKFSRQDVALIHDNYKTGVRYQLGDILPTTSGLQSSTNLLGINIERRYRQINPLRNIRSSGRSRFTLDRAARVSFEVNGVIISTQQLESGDYSVEDFPLTFGANNVRVFVDDGTGNIEVANFSAFSDLDLLAPGVSNFGVSLGVPRTGDARSRRYGDDPQFYGFYERGINQNLTLGAQVEVAENQALLGSTAVYGTRIGLFGVEAAVSKREGFDNGYGTTLTYNYESDVGNGWGFRSDLQFDYSSDDFGSINTDGEVSSAKELLATLGFTKAGYVFSINGGISESDGSQRKSFSTRLFKSFGRFDLSLDYRYAQVDSEPSSDNFGISISSRFGRSSSVQAEYQTSGDQYRLGWNGNSRFSAGEGSINRILLTNNDSINSAQLDGGYIGSRFVLGVDHLESQSNVNTGNDASITTVRASTAIGFADGKFAFGRPFSDGFLIVDTHKTLRGKKVSVKRGSTEGNLITTSKRLSTTLVPHSGSYRQQRLKFVINDLPLGYDLGASEVDIFPSFLSGYRYKLGSDAANTVIGKVLWPDKTAPSLIVGKLVPLDGGEELTIFTNKTGRFVAERATIGTYRMVFNNGENDFEAEVEVTTDNDEPGLVQIGTVILEETK